MTSLEMVEKGERGNDDDDDAECTQQREKPWIILTYGKCVAQVPNLYCINRSLWMDEKS